MLLPKRAIELGTPKHDSVVKVLLRVCHKEERLFKGKEGRFPPDHLKVMGVHRQDFMSLMRFDPERELLSLRDAMNRLMGESFVLPSMLGEIRGEGRAWGLAVDMFEADDHLVIKASLPGVKPENLNITVQGETLTIKAETREEQEKKEGHYYYHERRQGAFSRSLTLPFPIQGEKVEAIFENGVLTLTLPKAEAIRPRSIKVATKQ